MLVGPVSNDGPDRHCCHGYFIGRNVQPYDLNLTIHVQLFSIGVQYFYYLFNFLFLIFIIILIHSLMINSLPPGDDMDTTTMVQSWVVA